MDTPQHAVSAEQPAALPNSDTITRQRRRQAQRRAEKGPIPIGNTGPNRKQRRAAHKNGTRK